ncbi:MAG: hypothetical protein IT381_22120 [Deltaproteobacteria bacterium]|nr:hypothetical protein [Deltaproteobacteria bacterium]
MIEDTVFILKPDAVPHRAAIMEELAARFQIVSLRDFHCDIALSAKLYPDDIGRPIFRGIAEYMAEGPCTVGVLRGDDAIAPCSLSDS